MPLNELNEMAGYYPSDEAAVAKLEGRDFDPAQKLIAAMQVQVDKAEREKHVMTCQLTASKKQARNLSSVLEICRERNADLKAQLAELTEESAESEEAVRHLKAARKVDLTKV